MTTTENKQTILVVDDVPKNIRILNEILEQDYQVLCATNGHNALEIATNQIPDMILLDVLMPVMNGYEVCQKLKENSFTKDIPIIFVTAMDDEINEMEGLEIGAIDYITKPIKSAVAKLRIKNHMELKKHRDFLANLSNIDGLTAHGR